MGNEGVTPPHLSEEEIWGPEDRRGKLVPDFITAYDREKSRP